MSKQNAYLARKEALAQARLNRELRTHTQIAADAAAIAANEVLHLGPGRAEAFHRAFCAAYHDIVEAIITDMEYAQIAVDRRLQPIYGDKFAPWSERYGGDG